MSDSPCEKLITFVIPTRNRQDCVCSLLKTFARFYREKSSKFNVVIIDNSDNESLAKEVTNCPFEVVYVYSALQLSVVDNFNQGAAYLLGTYACFMGDDDLISERIFDLAESMKERKIDSAIVSPKAKGIYFWPSIVAANWGGVGGSLFLGDYSGKVLPVVLEDAIQQSRARLGDGPQLLPRVYSGLITKSCIDSVISKYGSLFGGCSPDVYSSRLLSSVVRSHITVDLPILLAGASGTSTSAQRAERSDNGKLTGNDHLGRFRHLSWDPRIPEFYSPFTVWAQSYLEAENLLGGSLYNKHLAYLYAKCLLFARGNYKTVMAASKQSTTPKWQRLLMLWYVFFLPVRFFVQKLPLLINWRPGACRHVYSDLASSYEANLLLDDKIRAIPLKLLD